MLLMLTLKGFTVTMPFAITLYLLVLGLSTQASEREKSHSKPAIQQAKNYKAVNDISEYWLSEKLDGMRGYWNGKQLLTRQGHLIHSPAWFTQYWPEYAVDGELWLGRDQFQSTLSCVRKTHIDENCWRRIRFMAFDLPQHKGTFTSRIKAMQTLIAQTNSPYLMMVKQFKLQNIAQLENTLNNIIKNKGEGLMLHRENAYYYVGRTANIMKLKKHQDAEAIVIAHISGKGKYQNLLGALKVKTADGITFKIGVGFSDVQRANPPAIGSVITYKYNGKTQAGIPRFARYFRLRENKKTRLSTMEGN